MDFFKKYFRGDRHIWAIIIGLYVISLLAVYSATGTLAYRFRGGDTTAYIIRHAVYLCIGLFVTFVVHRVPYRVYSRLSQLLIWLVPIALAATIMLGVNENSATRRLGIIQTSDLAKLVLIMFLARSISIKLKELRNFKQTLFPIFMWIGIVCGLIMPSNLSTAILLYLTCIAMLFAAPTRVWHIIALLAGTIVAGFMLIYALNFLYDHGINNKLTQRAPTWVARMTGQSDPYQIEQSEIAIGTVSIFGRGPGNSIQRNFLPQAFSDYIFSIIVEEYGVIGALFVLFLYLMLLYRTIVIMRRCKKAFPAFLVFGMACSVVFQAMLHILVCVGIGPVTGQPLPLISMGGNSIVATSIALGIILSISREIKEPKPENQAVQADETVVSPEPSPISETH